MRHAESKETDHTDGHKQGNDKQGSGDAIHNV